MDGITYEQGEIQVFRGRWTQYGKWMRVADTDPEGHNVEQSLITIADELFERIKADFGGEHYIELAAPPVPEAIDPGRAGGIRSIGRFVTCRALQVYDPVANVFVYRVDVLVKEREHHHVQTDQQGTQRAAR